MSQMLSQIDIEYIWKLGTFIKRRRVLGRLLKGFRRGCGMSVYEIARTLKVTEVSIRAWEKGQRVPPADVFLCLLYLYGHEEAPSENYRELSGVRI